MKDTDKRQDAYKSATSNSVYRGGGNIEETAYEKKTIKRRFDGKEIDFTSATPQYNEADRQTARSEIESGLYAVFSKYI